MASARKDLVALTPAAFREYVRFHSLETVLGQFRALDSDNSGEMTINEFRVGVRKLGFVAATDEDCELVFSWLDRDGSGVVPFKELDKTLRSRPAEAGAASEGGDGSIGRMRRLKLSALETAPSPSRRKLPRWSRYSFGLQS